MRTSLLILLALFCIPTASAVGPWLGTASNGLGYTAVVHGGVTTVADGSHSVSVPGKWGIPRVTLNNGVGGLSANGRVLVLAEDFSPTGGLQKSSSFAVLGAKSLKVLRTIVLKGDFGFDTLSPDGGTLYLIQHVSQRDIFRYRVRAYDLATRTLLSRVIADKSQRDWLMNGYPVARATTENGRWVYTLYSNPDNYPFVHALDTVHRTAVCVGIPMNWTTNQAQINQSTLRVQGGKLKIGGSFVLDRTTFKVTKT
jgi:hypothetical protein